MSLLSLLFSLQLELELELIIQRTKLVHFADKRKLVIRVTYSNIIRVYARSAIMIYTKLRFIHGGYRLLISYS